MNPSKVQRKLPTDPDTDRGLLSGLNVAQRQAVTHGTGPLLIVAGAGTGKTTVLTRRIAWLIEHATVKAEQILALTFTDKAANELATRLDRLLPLGQSDVAAHTFHSFGRRILEEEALTAGLPPEFSVLSEPEQLVFLGDRLQTLPNLEHFRPLGTPFRHIPALIKLFSHAADELVGPSEYARYAEALTTGVTTDEATTEASRQRELARIYAAYEQWKRDAGVVDYGDLIRRLIDLIRSNGGLRDRLQSRYRHILVDEFQDTNVAQYELVRSILGPDQNLTVCGDDDQAIFKFRGASVSNILGFLDDFPDATRVTLTENYRSNQPILDASYRLIQGNNPDRLEPKLGLNKRLTSSVAACDDQLRSSPAVTVRRFDRDSSEAEQLVATIRDRHRAGVPYHEIALLARSNAQLDDLARSLAISAIPYRTAGDRSFLSRPEIRGVLAFLVSLVHPTDSLNLLKLALSPFYGLDPNWLLVFNDAVRAEHRSLHAVLHDEASSAWSTLPLEGAEPLRRFRDELTAYRQQIPKRTVGDLLYAFLTSHGGLQLDGVDDHERVANLAAVFTAIRSWSRAGRDPHALSFVDYLDQLAPSIQPPLTEPSTDQSAVNLLTIHAAKGLEFDTVLLPGWVHGRFPASARREALPLPEALTKERLPEGDEHLEEERRLAYVALTRAKHVLLVTAAERYGTGPRPRRPSRFMTELLGSSETPPLESTTTTNQAALAEFAPIVAEPTPLRYREVNGVISLSPAKIESYRNCPAEFYWRHVLQAPSPPTAVLVYGNAVHAGIEAIHRLHQQGTARVDRLVSAAVERFETSWQPDGFSSAEQAAQLKKRGHRTLERFARQALTALPPDRVESWIHVTLASSALSSPRPAVVSGEGGSKGLSEPHDIDVRGRIDALWLTPELEIRDYKTSENVADTKTATRRAKENLPLLIYGYALKVETGRQPNRLVLDFVETNQLGIVRPTEAELVSVVGTIQVVVAGIRAGRFEPNPNRHRCDVCRPR